MYNYYVAEKKKKLEEEKKKIEHKEMYMKEKRKSKNLAYNFRDDQ